MKISDEAMTDALVRELCTGRKFKEASQHARERAAAIEASHMRGHRNVPGLGKCVLNLPAHEFFLMREKYGDEAFSDRGFLRDIQRLESQFKVHSV